MQITHEEAHRLIQFNSDHALKADQKHILQSHLENCMDCREYAGSINRMESILKPLMQRTWSHPHAPLPLRAILSRGSSRITKGMILATRIAAVGVMAIVFMFGFWQFTVSSGQTPDTLSVSVPPVPTPSTQLTSTSLIPQNCTQSLYIVEQNDTLEGIAAQFSVAKEDILAINTLNHGDISPGLELVIQICRAQPTGTVHATNTTFTPLTSPIPSTPGG